MNSRQFAIIAGITFFVGMVWLFADIIFNTKASIQISPKLQTLLEPVNPNFSSRVLEIVDKETLDTADITISEPTFSPEPSVVPIPTSPTPDTATNSADLNI